MPSVGRLLYRKSARKSLTALPLIRHRAPLALSLLLHRNLVRPKKADVHPNQIAASRGPSHAGFRTEDDQSTAPPEAPDVTGDGLAHGGCRPMIFLQIGSAPRMWPGMTLNADCSAGCLHRIHCLMIGLFRPATTTLMIAALLTGTPVSGHFRHGACPEWGEAGPVACGAHQHGGCERLSRAARAGSCVDGNSVAVPAESGARENPCPNCPTCPAHGSCVMCGAGQTMVLPVAWMPTAANLVVSRTSTDCFVGYESLLGSELLRPPAT
jgi:hypothetical protein